MRGFERPECFARRVAASTLSFLVLMHHCEGRRLGRLPSVRSPSLLAGMLSAVFAAIVGPGLTYVALAVGRITTVIVCARSRCCSDRGSAVDSPSRCPAGNTRHTHGRQRPTDPRLRRLNGQRNAALVRPAGRKQRRARESRTCNRKGSQSHLHGVFSVYLPDLLSGPISLSRCGRRLDAPLPDRGDCYHPVTVDLDQGRSRVGGLRDRWNWLYLP